MKRLHKVIHGKDFSHFQSISVEGENLRHLDVAVDDVNSRWPNYDEVCVETHSLDFHVSDLHEVPATLVLRGHVRCCCAGPCFYHEDHDLTKGGAFANAKRYNHLLNGNANKPHSPGEDYVEGTIDLGTMRPIHGEAYQRVPNVPSRILFAKEIADEAILFDLSADEIEGHLGVAGKDTNGVISTKGGVTAVLTGNSETPEDYFWTAAFVILWQRLLHNAYNKLTKDWPQRHRITANHLPSHKV